MSKLSKELQRIVDSGKSDTFSSLIRKPDKLPSALKDFTDTELRIGQLQNGTKVAVIMRCLNGKGIVDVMSQAGPCRQVWYDIPRAVRDDFMIYEQAEKEPVGDWASLQRAHASGLGKVWRDFQPTAEKFAAVLTEVEPNVPAVFAEMQPKIFREDPNEFFMQNFLPLIRQLDRDAEICDFLRFKLQKSKAKCLRSLLNAKNANEFYDYEKWHPSLILELLVHFFPDCPGKDSYSSYSYLQRRLYRELHPHEDRYRSGEYGTAYAQRTEEAENFEQIAAAGYVVDGCRVIPDLVLEEGCIKAVKPRCISMLSAVEQPPKLVPMLAWKEDAKGNRQWVNMHEKVAMPCQDEWWYDTQDLAADSQIGLMLLASLSSGQHTKHLPRKMSYPMVMRLVQGVAANADFEELCSSLQYDATQENLPMKRVGPVQMTLIVQILQNRILQTAALDRI